MRHGCTRGGVVQRGMWVLDAMGVKLECILILGL
jgi:hypothetical protein